MDHPEAGLVKVIQYPNNREKGMATKRTADGMLDMIGSQLLIEQMFIVCIVTGAWWEYLPYEVHQGRPHSL